MTDESMPIAEPSGFVRTLNNQGFMTSTLDPYSQAFVQFCGVAPGPALEIGAAYGVATLEAIKHGRPYFANDTDERHLRILRSRAADTFRKNLHLVKGAFPDDFEFAPNSLGAILMARVLHFFQPPKVGPAVRKMFDWLQPGGKAIVVVETPYLKNWATFTPEYEKRKASGDPWPGYVQDTMKYAPARGISLPPEMHFFDPDILAREFTAAGFEVEKVGFINRTDFPDDLRLDGRESVGIIGTKPSKK